MITAIKGHIAFRQGMKKESDLIKYAQKHGYHEHIDTLPIYNWFKCADGELGYLHKRYKAEYPRFYTRMLYEMQFQFEHRDNSSIRDSAKLAYLKSLHATAENPAQKAKFSNLYRSHEAFLKKSANTEHKKTKLNELINTIEEINKQIGAIDVHKMSTSRFFSLYNRSVEKAKKQQDVNN